MPAGKCFVVALLREKRFRCCIKIAMTNNPTRCRKQQMLEVLYQLNMLLTKKGDVKVILIDKPPRVFNI